MSATSPWWASGLFTVIGAVLGALPPFLISLLNRRSERHRLSRSSKETAYPQLHHTASALARMPVWPTDAGDPGSLLDTLDTLAHQVSFFGPARVSDTLPELLTAAEQHAGTIQHLRAETRPAHGNTVDQRHAGSLHASADRLRTATTRFVRAARRDLEIPTRYRAPVDPESRNAEPTSPG